MVFSGFLFCPLKLIIANPALLNTWGFMYKFANCSFETVSKVLCFLVGPREDHFSLLYLRSSIYALGWDLEFLMRRPGFEFHLVPLTSLEYVSVYFCLKHNMKTIWQEGYENACVQSVFWPQLWRMFTYSHLAYYLSLFFLLTGLSFWSLGLKGHSLLITPSDVGTWKMSSL